MGQINSAFPLEKEIAALVTSHSNDWTEKGNGRRRLGNLYRTINCTPPHIIWLSGVGIMRMILPSLPKLPRCGDHSLTNRVGTSVGRLECNGSWEGWEGLTIPPY